jgi:hypothetical protein
VNLARPSFLLLCCRLLVVVVCPRQHRIPADDLSARNSTVTVGASGPRPSLEIRAVDFAPTM